MDDQPATIGASPITVPQAAGVLACYLPGLAMGPTSRTSKQKEPKPRGHHHGGPGTLPPALQSIQLPNKEVAELSMLCSFDDNLAGQVTSTSNHIQDLLTQIHPALDRVLGP